MGLSKSKFTSFKKCPKKLWNDENHPEEKILGADQIARMKTGNDVGDLAMRLLGDYVEVTEHNPDGTLNLSEMIEKTRICLENRVENICEASFSFNGLYCAVDILHKLENGYSIYEVKSTTKVKDSHITDVAFQRYVLTNCGINVEKTYVVTINENYVLHGKLNIQELFNIVDVSEMTDVPYDTMEADISAANEILMKKDEPVIEATGECKNCEYFNYCYRNIPRNNVFDLYRLNKNYAAELYNQGVVTFKDIIESQISLSEIQKRQIDYSLNKRDVYIDEKKLKSFLNDLKYPLYFLDFETIMYAVPVYEGTKPYQQIPFQYSLHRIDYPGGQVKHFEYLAEPGTGFIRKIAENLCRDIPGDSTVLVYYCPFEKGRIGELAEMFPDLKTELLNIKNRIVDLMVPFSNGSYYKKEIGGSFSIKSILPALFPDDPVLNYNSLIGVHNGGEAMETFRDMNLMSEEDKRLKREHLLRYCELDTLAMVKILGKLEEAVVNG